MPEQKHSPIVFISWSGGLGQRYAEALKETIFSTGKLEPWVSSQDIATGAAWFGAIQTQLKEATHAVVCITREAIDSCWVHFEIGALWQRVDTFKPILLGIEKEQLTSSLFSHIQAVSGRDKKEIYKLLLEMLDESDRKAGLSNFDGAWKEWLNRVKKINLLSEDENVESLAQAILQAFKTHSGRDLDFIFRSCATQGELKEYGFPFDLALYGYLRMRGYTEKGIIRTAYNSSLLLKVMNEKITSSHVDAAVKAALDILERGIKREEDTPLKPWDTQIFLAAPAIDDSAKSVAHTPYANVHLLSLDGEYKTIGPHENMMKGVLKHVSLGWLSKFKAG